MFMFELIQVLVLWKCVKVSASVGVSVILKTSVGVNIYVMV